MQDILDKYRTPISPNVQYAFNYSERFKAGLEFGVGLKARIGAKEDNDLLHYTCFFFGMSI
jgi:hypothetical protein